LAICRGEIFAKIVPNQIDEYHYVSISLSSCTKELCDIYIC